MCVHMHMIYVVVVGTFIVFKFSKQTNTHVQFMYTWNN